MVTPHQKSPSMLAGQSQCQKSSGGESLQERHVSQAGAPMMGLIREVSWWWKDQCLNYEKRRFFCRNCTDLESTPSALLTLVAALAGKRVWLHLSPRGGVRSLWSFWLLPSMVCLAWRTFPFALLCLSQWDTNESQLWYPEWLVLVSSCHTWGVGAGLGVWP